MHSHKAEHGVFRGRLNRMGFMMANLYWGILIFAVFVAVTIAIAASNKGTFYLVLAIIVSVIGLLFVLFAYVLYIGFIIRRLHDINQSGLFALLLLAPVINNIFVVALFFIPGTDGPNEFGKHPQATLGFSDVSGL